MNLGKNSSARRFS